MLFVNICGVEEPVVPVLESRPYEHLVIRHSVHMKFCNWQSTWRGFLRVPARARTIFGRDHIVRIVNGYFQVY